MSFANDTKSELLNVKSESHCELAELSALLRLNGNVNLSSEGLSVTFNTTSLGLARKVIKMIKELYKVEVEIRSKKQMKLSKNDIYIVIIKEKASQIINELSLMNPPDNIFDDPLLINECCRKAFLRGAFLASGSINSPKSSSYHLEIHTKEELESLHITALLNGFHLKGKTLQRKRGYISYIKDSEKISDFLRVTEAMNSLFAYEDERIKRDFVNSITRVMNMDIANQNKTLAAATNQMRSISILENMTDINKLPKSMKEAIELRKKHPESSLNELSEYAKEHFNKAISKSALNHRFRNINEMADQIMRNLNE